MFNSRTKILIAILVGVAIIVVLVYVLLSLKPKQSGQNNNNQQQQTQPTIERTDIDPKTVPQGIPTEIPIEKDAVILQNYSEIDSLGRKQSTRVFVTKKSLADN